MRLPAKLAPAVVFESRRRSPRARPAVIYARGGARPVGALPVQVTAAAARTVPAVRRSVRGNTVAATPSQAGSNFIAAGRAAGAAGTLAPGFARAVATARAGSTTVSRVAAVQSYTPNSVKPTIVTSGKCNCQTSPANRLYCRLVACHAANRRTALCGTWR